ncbi:hypothetical protein CVT24_010981 [Panaeolus cyanescens]|uniref:Uncharacterized protein n=1 Tax=Panaeolus cyanescens TaxID=181874 RepID=A0A409YVQ0_9AGAR|nr:hypothetical protein CVT24_010981 [Panaeolus cyanescens]
MLPIDDSFRSSHESPSSRCMGNPDLQLQSGYSRMPSLQPRAECSTRPSAFGIHDSLLGIGACNPCNDIFCDTCERGGVRVAHPTSSGNCYNERNVKEHVPMDAYKSSRPHIYQSSLQHKVDGHHAMPFLMSTPLFHGGLWEGHSHSEKQHMESLDSAYWDADVLSSDDNDDWTSRRPYLQVDTTCKWTHSPESDSMETDTDDDSLLSNSTLSFSPPYSDSSDPPLPAHLFDLEDERHASSSTSSPQRAPSIPLARTEANHIYPPLEEYPEHFQLHDITPMDLPSHASHHLYDHYDHEPLSSEAGPSRKPISPLGTSSGSLFSSTPSELSFSNPFDVSPLLSFHYPSEWTPYDYPVPCSPSRRRSRDLPLPDSDPTQTRPSSGIKLLSLPGAITDDDLIPASLASNNFIPDLEPISPPTPATAGLLLWGTDGPISDADLPIRRSYSPEPDSDLNGLDSKDLDELAERAGVDIDKEEVRRVYEMRTRKRSLSACSGLPHSQEKWEREQARELGLLLKLKLHLGEDNQKDKRHDSKTVMFADTPELTPSSTAASSRRSSVDETMDESSRSQASQPSKTSPKNRISSIDQLVANMVFHRQQEPLRRHPVRTRTWSPVSNTAFVPTSSPLSPKGSSRALESCKPSFVSPKSPLRHVILPGEDDDNSGDLVADDDVLDLDFLPLNTFAMGESSWLESAPAISTGQDGEAEHDRSDAGESSAGNDAKGNLDEERNEHTDSALTRMENTTPTTTANDESERFCEPESSPGL